MNLREDILKLVEQYCAERHAVQPFVAGESAVPVAGRVFDGEEMRLLVDSALDFWLIVILALLLGALLIIPIGVAEMPVVI